MAQTIAYPGLFVPGIAVFDAVEPTNPAPMQTACILADAYNRLHQLSQMAEAVRCQVASSIISSLLLFMKLIGTQIEVGYHQVDSHSPRKQRHAEVLFEYRAEIGMVEGWLAASQAYEQQLYDEARLELEAQQLEATREMFRERWRQARDDELEQSRGETEEDHRQIARALESAKLAARRAVQIKQWVKQTAEIGPHNMEPMPLVKVQWHEPARFGVKIETGDGASGPAFGGKRARSLSRGRRTGRSGELSKRARYQSASRQGVEDVSV